MTKFSLLSLEIDGPYRTSIWFVSGAFLPNPPFVATPQTRGSALDGTGDGEEAALVAENAMRPETGCPVL
jgi:hypothetical protein